MCRTATHRRAWHADRRVPRARRDRGLWLPRGGVLSDDRPAGSLRFGAIGFAGGFLGSLLGVGGGFVMVPLQVMWAKVSQHRANGTSLGVIVPIALAGVPIYALAGGKVDFRLMAPLVVGSVFGAYIGARVASRVPEATLRRVVAVVLLVVGLRQILFPG